MIKETTKNLWIGIARTASPLLAGYIGSLFVMAGLELTPEQQEQVTLLVFAVLSLGYYVLSVLFERYLSPKFGWLLGVAKKPEYIQTVTDNADVGSKAWNIPLVNGDEGRAG